MQKKIYLSLESIRGIAALMVAFLHFHIAFPFNFFSKSQITESFWLMVDLFFVLSGFVIVYNYKDKLVNAPTLLNFYLRRTGRLYPLFFFTSIFFFLEPIAEFIKGSGGDIPFRLGWDEGLVYLFMIQGFGLTERGLLNYVTWSINVEVQLYIIFSLFLFSEAIITLLGSMIF